MTTNDILLLVLVGVVFVIAFFVFLPWRMKRSVYKVIQLFREHSATSAEYAVTAEELGIKPFNLLQLGFRDYKHDALDALIRSEVIQVTEDNKYYLSEEHLIKSKIYRSYTSRHS